MLGFACMISKHEKISLVKHVNNEQEISMTTLNELRKQVTETGTATITESQFKSLLNEFNQHILSEEDRQVERIKAIELVVETFSNGANLHDEFLVTPNALYDFCDELYKGNSVGLSQPDSKKVEKCGCDSDPECIWCHGSNVVTPYIQKLKRKQTNAALIKQNISRILDSNNVGV